MTPSKDGDDHSFVYVAVFHCPLSSLLSLSGAILWILKSWSNRTRYYYFKISP